MLRRTTLGILVLVGACGNARVVQRTQYGGVLALEGNRTKAMEGAHREMAAHCKGDGNYRITMEREEPIGTITEYGERDRPGATTEVTETTTKTELRIHYLCGRGDAPPSSSSPTTAGGAS